VVTPETLIVGGGLSGLAIADALHHAGRSFFLLDARNRLGGRILTETIDGHGYDMGPAWFWPGQPLIDQLITRFGIQRFEQYTDGLMTAEDARGHVQQGQAFAAMAGSFRLVGGMAALTEALAAPLPKDSVRLNSSVQHIAQVGQGLRVDCTDGTKITTQRVIFAMPPRLVAQIAFTPVLPAHAIDAMRSIPTWMAGQAKALAVYDTPFWRQAGLSGDAMSRHGPMVEIHDASPANGSDGALFGFIGIPATHRKTRNGLQTDVAQQLIRLFGPQAAKPKHLILKDWADDPFTATASDQAGLTSHPAYGYPAAFKTLWDDSLLFARSEVAVQTGGFLEGALEAAAVVSAKVIGSRT